MCRHIGCDTVIFAVLLRKQLGSVSSAGLLGWDALLLVSLQRTAAGCCGCTYRLCACAGLVTGLLPAVTCCGVGGLTSVLQRQRGGTAPGTGWMC